MKKFFALLICAVFVFCSCGEGFKRELKSLKSNYGGGLERTLTLMDYNGDTLKTWSGKFDVRDDSADNRIFLILTESAYGFRVESSFPRSFNNLALMRWLVCD